MLFSHLSTHSTVRTSGLRAARLNESCSAYPSEADVINGRLSNNKDDPEAERSKLCLPRKRPETTLLSNCPALYKTCSGQQIETPVHMIAAESQMDAQGKRDGALLGTHQGLFVVDDVELLLPMLLGRLALPLRQWKCTDSAIDLYPVSCLETTVFRQAEASPRKSTQNCSLQIGALKTAPEDALPLSARSAHTVRKFQTTQRACVRNIQEIG